MNILFVGAHPDDIETFCGGTAALYAEQGHKVYFCVATNGNVGSSTLSKEKIAAVRHQEAKTAAGIIGAELIWLDFDDEFLIDSVETRHAFIEAFRIARPDVIFCHFREDYNPDHSISGMIVDECAHMGTVPNIKTNSPPTDGIPHVYFMDTPAGVNFAPEIYVDITKTFAKKVKMVGAHASQGQWMKDVFGYDMEAFLEIPAKFRGLQASCPMAEAFRPSYRWGRTFRQHYLPIWKELTMQRAIAVVLLLFAVSASAIRAEPETMLSGPSASLPTPVQADLADRANRDPRVRDYVVPKRIVWQSPDDEQATVEHAETLLKVGDGQVTLEMPVACTLRNNGKAPAVLLDFGRELHGGVQIMISASSNNQPVRVRVRFGESVSEAMSELGGPKNATNDVAIRDQTCLIPWLGTHEIGNTGFRFVRIDLLDPDSFVVLKAVRAVFLYRDLPYKGSFRCSDERLNRIWQTGAYTVHLNMQDYLWDGIKRDRLVWLGDMHPETMTICSVFGDVDVVPASLDLIRDHTPLPEWMHTISSYSMWWVLIHREWYRHYGDLAYLQQQKPYLTGLLKQLINHIGPDNAETLPEVRFLDWPSSGNKQAIHAGLHSLLILSLQAGGELCGVLDDPAMRDKCDKAVARLKKHVPDPGNSKQAAALMTLAGLGDATALNHDVMAVDGAKRLSAFYGYYVLQARAKAGDYQGCLDCIRDYWGGMLDLGATTFWEDFDLDWTANAGRIDELVPPGKKDIHGDFGNHCYKGFRHSLCHGWSSGPTAWLSEYVLGIQIVEPGCKKIKIEPHLGDLDWAEGTFPTPHGILKVRHEKQPDGTVRSTVDAPAGVHIIGKRN